MNAYATQSKESIRFYQGGRKEYVRERNIGKRNEKGPVRTSESAYGQLLREFMGTPVESRGVKLYPAENLL